MRFSKVHGLGNDFVLVDLRGGGALPQDEAGFARAVCDRRFGAGADGVLALLPSSVADARMRVLNADGSEAEMCGNGLRCVAKHIYDRDPIVRRAAIRIETGAGLMRCQVASDEEGRAQLVSVAMGRPHLLRGEVSMTGEPADRCLEEPLELGGRIFRVTALSMGNPHAVAFVDESTQLSSVAEQFGPLLEVHPWFPAKTNAGFARMAGLNRIELVVWERGCGITMACGTGACAAAVAACLTGRAEADRDLEVRLPGGCLQIIVARDYQEVTMRGPAAHVFDATIDVDALTTRS